MKKTIILISLAVVISGITLLSFWGGKQTCMMMMTEKTSYEGLNLSAGQEKTLTDLDDSFRKEVDMLCMNVCRERTALMNLLSETNSNPEAIYKKIEEIGGLQVGLEKKTADHILEIKKTLSPRQTAVYLKRVREELQKSIQQCASSMALKS
ncbi:MAG: periplasmic heavy metal sensor [Candidatus Omnitrophica bacterium]|nr:periplasmic heavy metal sensor [Candidatus Omnitrophota bacterium]